MQTEIRINADYPGGNVALADCRLLDDRYEVSFTAHPHGGPEALWFCFQVIQAADRVRDLRLVLRHVANLLGMQHAPGVRPVVRRDGGDWVRLPAPEVLTADDGQRAYAWDVAEPSACLEVALCYPYGVADLDQLANELGQPWRLEPIGVSPAGRPLQRLSNTTGVVGDSRPGFYIIARQHSGETTGSWVLDGLLRRLAERGPNAPLVWSVPLANIDGVVQGDYGKDNFPYDLNRAWGQCPMRHETLVIQRDIARWRQRCRPVLVLDLHGPGGSEDNGIYAFLPDPDTAPEWGRTMAAWAHLIAAALGRPLAAERFNRVATYRSRWETPNLTRYAREQAGLAALTLEIPYGAAGDLVLTREHYRKAGRRIADGLCRHPELLSEGDD